MLQVLARQFLPPQEPETEEQHRQMLQLLRDPAHIRAYRVRRINSEGVARDHQQHHDHEYAHHRLRSYVWSAGIQDGEEIRR